MSLSEHKCYISFKTEDVWYKNYIQSNLDVDMIDKSLNEPINSSDDDYIMRVIRDDYLSDSTVTIFLIGTHSAENLGQYSQRFIKRELQASLYDGAGNTRNGILGIVLPEMTDTVYCGEVTCSVCDHTHNLVRIDNSTTVIEFSYNYYLPTNKCAWSEEDRYCVLTKWSDFVEHPELYIETAYEKRSDSISDRVKVRP